MSPSPQQPGTGDSPGSKRRVFYTDDFSDPQSGWPVGRLEEGVTLSYEGGTYRIFLPERDTLGYAYLEAIFDDFELEVEIARLRGAKDSELGVQCRVNEAGGYGFWMTGEGTYGIYKIYYAQTEDGDDEVISLFEGAGADLKTGAAFNQMRAVCAGSALRLYLNGEKLVETVDADFQRGVIGLLAAAGEADSRGNLEVRFKNLVVREP
jgi:hypothetical protein